MTRGERNDEREAEPGEDGARDDAARVTQRFDAYRERSEAGEAPDPEAFARELPAEDADELRRRIEVFESLQSHRDRIVPARSVTPERLGRFEIRSSLGAGGLSRVYLAFDTELGREVALKVLDRSLVPDRRERAWILNEARSLASLAHPGVVRVFDVGNADGYDFVAIEHLTGPTLAQVIRALARGTAGPAEDDGGPAGRARRIADGLRTHRELADCFRRIAEALAYCHARGVIHRDIKPENVVFAEDGTPRLIDFGLAHLAGRDEAYAPNVTREFVGTRAYLAPEQAESERTGADPRSDQFSLATVFYECLTLENPFDDGTARGTTEALLRCAPPPIRRRVRGVPEDLATIVHKGLSRDPDERFATVGDLAEDLAAFLAHRPIRAVPPPLRRRAALWTRRHGWKVALGGLLVAGPLAALVVSGLASLRLERDGILRALGDVEERGLRGDEAFLSSAFDLLALRERVASFEARLGHGLVDPIPPHFERTVHDWSRRLAAAYSDEVARGSPNWPFLLRMEEDLCPSCTANAVERRRGRVLLPWKAIDERPWRLARVAPPPDKGFLVEVFEPCELSDRLNPGTYRLRVWAEDRSRLAHELVFVVAQPRALERRLRLYDAERTLPGLGPSPFLDEAVFVDTTTLALVPSGSTRVPAFRILPRLVRPAEFEAFLSSEAYEDYLVRSERDSCSYLPHDGNDVVGCDLDVAMAFAAWVGGRIPSAGELTAAADAGVIDLAGPTTREWIRNQNWRMGSHYGTFFTHAKYAPGVLGPGEGTVGTRFGQGREDTSTGRQGIAFRISFPAEL